METIEYAVATITYKQIPTEDVNDIYQMIFELTTFEVIEGKRLAKVVTEEIEGATFTGYDTLTDWRPDYDPDFGGPGRVRREWDYEFQIEPKDLTLAMAPYLSDLGSQGWEVTEYKFSTNPIFAQALLKRKTSN
jgi:hypothetical protein